jgi:hypothetical protein
MPEPKIRIAKLDEPTLEKIRVMEEELGTPILALEPYLPAAPLTPDQVERLKKLEQDLGVILLAYKQD